MIFMTAMGIGLAAGMTRSVISIVVAALLIAATFAAACVLNHSIALVPFLLAMAGFNGGLLTLLGLAAFLPERNADAH